jgi:hypothetical protein
VDITVEPPPWRCGRNPQLFADVVAAAAAGKAAVGDGRGSEVGGGGETGA